MRILQIWFATLLFSIQAYASDVTALSVNLKALKSSQITCTKKDDANCPQAKESCEKAISGQFEAMQKALTIAGVKETQNTAAAKEAGAAITRGVNSADTALNGGAGATRVGANLEANAAQDAKLLASDAESCVKQIKSNCSTAVTGEQEAIRACMNIAEGATAVSSKKEMSAMEMMQLTNMGLGIAKTLESMMPKGSATPTTQVAAVTPPTIDPIGPKSATASLSITPTDNSGGAVLATATNGFMAGKAITGASGFSAKDALNAMSMDYKADPAAKISTQNMGTGSGLVGSGGGNTTGASSAKVADGKILENTKGTGDIAAMEYGSGGRSSFLGLKSTGSDLDSLVKTDDLKASGAMPMPSFGEEASRDLAGESVIDVNANPEITIFAVMSSKLKDMKKRGYL